MSYVSVEFVKAGVGLLRCNGDVFQRGGFVTDFEMKHGLRKDLALDVASGASDFGLLRLPREVGVFESLVVANGEIGS